jgi:hypothetical protein
MTPESARLERLHARHPLGWSRDWHLARTVELEDLLDQRSCEDFTVENGDRTVGEVAREVLVRAGWISADSTGSIERETDQVPHLVPNGASVREGETTASRRSGTRLRHPSQIGGGMSDMPREPGVIDQPDSSTSGRQDANTGSWPFRAGKV